MSPPSDHVDEMPNDLLTDEAIEAFFLGLPDPGWEQEASLATLVDDVAVAMSGPVPVADHALLRLFWGAPAPVEQARTAAPAWEVHVAGIGGSRPPVGASRGRLRLVAGAVLGTALALFGVGAAGATGVLPAPAQRVVARVVEAVSPFEMPQPGGSSSGPSNGGAPITGGAGGQVSTTVQQPAISAPGASSSDAPHATSPTSAPSPPPPGPGATGLDRANQTPAGESIPPFVSGSGATANQSPGNSGNTPATGLDRARQTPAATAVPSSVPGPPTGGPPRSTR